MTFPRIPLPANYGEPRLIEGERREHDIVVQEINDEWYVFPAYKLDEETGRYYGAIIAGAESEEEALRRVGVRS